MAAILKPHAAAVVHGNAAPSGLAGFNFEDLSQQAKGQLEAWRQEIIRLREQAIREADEIRHQSHNEGLLAGRAEAALEAELRLNQELDARMGQQGAVAQAMVRQLGEIHEQWMTQYAEALIETAVGIAQRVIRRRLEREPKIIADWVAEALWASRSANRLVVAVHPETLAEMGPSLDELLSQPGLPEDTTLVADESVSREGVVVRQHGGEVVATLDAQLARLAEVLKDA